MPETVKQNTGTDPPQVVTDAGFRSEAAFNGHQANPANLIVVLERKGKQQVRIDSKKRLLTAAMAEKFKSVRTPQAY